MAQLDPQYRTASHQAGQGAAHKKDLTLKPELSAATASIEQTARSPVSIHMPPATFLATTDEEPSASANKTKNTAQVTLGVGTTTDISTLKTYLENWAQEKPDDAQRKKTCETIMAFLSPSSKINKLTLKGEFPDIFHFPLFNEKLTKLKIKDYPGQTLPASIGTLTNLKSLTIKAPNLTSLPQSIEQCSRLKFLYLHAPSMQVFPGVIGKLTHLQSLILEEGSFKEVPDGALRNLTQLEGLSLNGSTKLVKLPEELGTLSKLGFFSLEDCPSIRLPQCLYTVKDNVLSITIPQGTVSTCARQYLQMLADALRQHPAHLPPLTINLKTLGDTTGIDANEARKTFLTSLIPYLNELTQDTMPHSERMQLCRNIGTLFSAIASSDKGYTLEHIFPEHFYTGLSFLLSLKRNGTILPPATLQKNLCLILADQPITLLQDHVDTNISQKLGRWASTLVKDEKEIAAKNKELLKMWSLFNAITPAPQIKKMFPSKSMEKYIGSPLPDMSAEDTLLFAELLRKALNPENKRFIEQAIVADAHQKYQALCAPLVEIAQAFSPLALQRAQGEDLQVLIETPATETVDARLTTALTRAVKQAHLPTIQTLLAARANINGQDENGETPLIIAARTGQLEIVKLLTQAGATIDAQDQRGDTALSHALAESRLDIVEWLQTHGAKMDYVLEQLEDRFIAHVWGLRGSSTRLGMQFALEGFQKAGAIKMLSEYVPHFFASQQNTSSVLTDTDKEEIATCVANAFPYVSDYSQMLSNIQSDKPVMILGGFTKHAISFVIYRNRLAICNRGLGRKENAVEFYDLASTPITKEMLETLTKVYEDKHDFDKMLASLPFPRLAAEDFDQESQKTGNCTWASAKGALGVLFRLYAQKNLKDPTLAELFYKDATHWFRLYAIKRYVTPTKVHTPNPNILQKLKEKFHTKRPTPQSEILIEQASQILEQAQASRKQPLDTQKAA